MARERHLFPGNNTSIGFYSYYQYIMPQEKANHIYCLKGGPGVGKSTFMKRIGSRMQERGFDAEYLHCSSDPDSLDGVVFPQIHSALIDGTAPHIVDPINPGAVDEIVNLGEYWELESIKKHKQAIIQTNKEVGRLFKRAYQYIAAAKKLLDDITGLFDNATDQAGAYSEAESVIEHVLASKPVGRPLGEIRKQFASAVTPKGIIHYLDTLIDDSYKVYFIKSHWGVGVGTLLARISKEAVIRGQNVEQYYCPLDPEDKIEHVVIPQLKLGFFTGDEYDSLSRQQHAVIDLTQYTDIDQIEKNKDALSFDTTLFQSLLNEAVATLKKAKAAHDSMEQYYIPNMDFDKVKEKEQEIFNRLTQNRV